MEFPLGWVWQFGFHTHPYYGVEYDKYTGSEGEYGPAVKNSNAIFLFKLNLNSDFKSLDGGMCMHLSQV